MKTDLLINATALNLLSCARHYQIEATWGYRERGPEAEFGVNFHEFAKRLALGEKVDLITIQGGSDTQLLQLCAFYQAMNPFRNIKPIRDLNNVPCVEYPFVIPYRESAKYRIFLCGTIDMIDIFEDCIRVIDHKTSRSTKAKEVLREYESHIQLPWYLYVLRHFLYHQFPDDIASLLARNQIFGQYHGVFISFSPAKFELSNRIILTKDLEDDIESLLQVAIQKAISIHELGQTLAPPEGMAAKICKNCFLNNLCITKKHDNLIAYLRSQTPTPYDPRTWH